MTATLINEFQQRFAQMPEQLFFCPGRINLIGEHIDYNGGKVLPCAITLGTWLAAASNKENKFRLHCLNFPSTVSIGVNDHHTKKDDEWFNYPAGIMNNLRDSGFIFSGLDMLYSGNLPIGAGLSSSASIEVLTAYALNEIFQHTLSKKDIALLSQKVENEFIGVNCGIMDQFSVALGKKDQAILLDCESLDYDYIPCELHQYSLVIINTNKQRRLTDSKYNERFAQCRLALDLIRKDHKKVKNLCDLTTKQFESLSHLIGDPVLVQRVRHVVGENERVNEAAIALRSGNIADFGVLMYASHQSLKDLYEVSGIELDTIVEYCMTDPACIGARMTGGGFGGCAIALVETTNCESFTGNVIKYYEERIGYGPGVFSSGIGDGVQQKIIPLNS